jgi:uncharacterized SAM-dependent methyltransferase
LYLIVFNRQKRLYLLDVIIVSVQHATGQDQSMHYFKHSELAKQHNVSLRTIHNWIEAVKAGKLDLTLHQSNNTAYIANTTKNVATIAELVETRKKYRNTNAVKVLVPKAEFYETFDEHSIHDIATNLEINHEIPRQYNYLDGGADQWDLYAQRLANETDPNTLNSTIKLLEMNQGYLDDLLSKYNRVNIVDIGVGNAYPSRALLAHLLDQEKLGRYIALDISPNIIAIAKQNITRWFGDKVNFESHICDINYDRFSDLLIEEYIREDAEDTLTVVLLLGGTLTNMRSPNGAYKVIHDSMGVNDLMIYTNKLDTEQTRKYFDFSQTPGTTKLAEIHRLVIDLLNIDESFYDVELSYNPELKQRIEQIRLKLSLRLRFQFKGGEREVELSKGSSILTWRAHQQSATDINRQLAENDFYVLHSSQTDDESFILAISRVKRNEA